MKKKIESDEIDLIEVIINIWNNKLKIAVISVIFMVLSTAANFVFKQPLKAKTAILPITIFEENSFIPYNISIRNFNKNKNKNENENENENNILYLKQINGQYLLNLFIEELKTKKNIIEAIKKYELIDQKKFNDENDYLAAVEKKALKIGLLRPINIDGSKKGETRLNWIIEYEINDPKKWEEVLNFVNNKINNDVQNYLKLNFNVTLNNLKMLNQYELEDLNKKIEFAKINYEIKTTNYLAFLNEQASIARELNIKNNTLEVENFSTSSGLISNIQTETPYYMRGYSMIEKEIELIEARTDKNKNAFTENLSDLEVKKRKLLEDRTLERIERLFNSTPIIKSNYDFKAAEIIYKDTKYEVSYSSIKIVLLAGIFGIIFGILYIVLVNAIQQRK